MKSSYTIERHPHGRLVIGSVPLDDAAGILKLAPEGSILHLGVASYYGACMAFGAKDEMELWAADIEESLKTMQPPELRFVSGIHCGLSSGTIVMALSTDAQARAKIEHRNGMVFSPNVPYDSGDFSRCHKLLELRPDWVPRIAEVGMKYPETKWPQLAAVWPELMTLFEAKKHKEVTDKIREAIK